MALWGSPWSPSVTPDKVLAISCAMSRWPGRERKPAVASTIWSKAASDRPARSSVLKRMAPDWVVWIDFSQRLLHRLHDLGRPTPVQKGLCAVGKSASRRRTGELFDCESPDHARGVGPCRVAVGLA